MADTAEQLLDLAERGFRREGYNAVSFRQLADAIGVKSASVHYHFRTKSDLGAAVVHRYTDRVISALGSPESSDDLPEKFGRMITIFSRARLQEDLICLCAMLGAEAESLPEIVRSAVNRFFDLCLDWLETVLLVEAPNAPRHIVKERAAALLSMLEGAMVVSGSMDDTDVFDGVCQQALCLAAAPY